MAQGVAKVRLAALEHRVPLLFAPLGENSRGVVLIVLDVQQRFLKVRLLRFGFLVPSRQLMST